MPWVISKTVIGLLLLGSFLIFSVPNLPNITNILNDIVEGIDEDDDVNEDGELSPFDLGQEAALDNRQRGDNPYNPDTEGTDWQDWNDGFDYWNDRAPVF